MKPSTSGEFSVDKLLPGTYELSLQHAGINIRGKARVELIGADQTEIRITPYKPAQVKLRLAVEGRERTESLVVSGSLRRTPVDFRTWCELEGGVCVFHGPRADGLGLLPGAAHYRPGSPRVAKEKD